MVTRPPVRNITFEDVYFDFDRYSLRPEATRLLDEAITALRENATLRIEIEGHTCNIGPAEYNLALGDRRAIGDHVARRRQRRQRRGREQHRDPEADLDFDETTQSVRRRDRARERQLDGQRLLPRLRGRARPQLPGHAHARAGPEMPRRPQGLPHRDGALQLPDPATARRPQPRAPMTLASASGTSPSATNAITSRVRKEAAISAPAPSSTSGRGGARRSA
ncbi:OmpA family protein, partial [Lacticaseibacillus rhamnosus]